MINLNGIYSYLHFLCTCFQRNFFLHTVLLNRNNFWAATIATNTAYLPEECVAQNSELPEWSPVPFWHISFFNQHCHFCHRASFQNILLFSAYCWDELLICNYFNIMIILLLEWCCWVHVSKWVVCLNSLLVVTSLLNIIFDIYIYIYIYYIRWIGLWVNLVF